MKTIPRCLGIAFPTAAALVLTSACSSEKQVPPPVSPGVTSMQAPSPPVRATPPNTPTASNVHISDEILRACNIPDADSYFAFDSSDLTTFDHGPLDSLATCFDTGPLKGRHMELVGHADPRGASDYNMTLGQSRADAVESYLADHGLSRIAMSSTSRGAMDATGHDETGWAHDRRVDVMLLNRGPRP